MAVKFMSESMTCNQCIEQICEQGCTVVREVISRLEQHQSVNELEHLASDEKDTVLKELKAVMSVYDNQ